MAPQRHPDDAGYDLNPRDRGLVLKANMPAYGFPSDYMQRLWTALAERNPEFRSIFVTRQGQAGAGQP